MTSPRDLAGARALACSQHAAITVPQLASFAISRWSARGLVDDGVLRVLPWSSVLAFADGVDEWTLAAGYCLANPRAVLSDGCAARWLELDGADGPPSLEVTAGRTASGRLPWVHRRSDLLPLDVDTCGVIRVTNATRTLIDWAGAVDLDVVERGLESALRRSLTSIPRLRWRTEAMQRKGRRGPAELLQVLDRRPPGAPPTESDAETRIVQALRRAAVPQPDRQVTVRLRSGGSVRLDFAWVDDRVFLEMDGWDPHGGQLAFKLDRRKRTELVAMGWTPLVATWEQLHDPTWLVAQVATTLAIAAARRLGA